VIRDVLSVESGVVTRFDAGRIGQAALELGAGRNKASDAVDPRVGFDTLVKVGSSLERGEVIARIHSRNADDADRAEAAVRQALVLG
jgi:thymidine phosphorylase